MKIFIKNAFFSFLTGIVLLLTAACVDPDKSNDVIDDIIPPVHLGAKLDIKNAQVWMPNYNTGKVSEMFLKFTGDRTVDVIVELVEYDDEGNPSFPFEKVGSGKIEKGILSFNVDVMDDSNLLDSDELLKHYFNEWYYDKDNNINIDMNPDVKGNIITLVTLYNNGVSAEAIIREGFSGTNDSLTGEYIYYLYVEDDCTISVKADVKKLDLKYTFVKFDNLTLKAGWNTICKSETYTTTGDSSYSIKLLNPPINWVIQKIK